MEGIPASAWKIKTVFAFCIGDIPYIKLELCKYFWDGKIVAFQILWDAMKKANALLNASCETNPLLTYIDAATPMLDEKGEPQPDIFIQDNLHLNKKGYDIWSKAIRSVLIRKESEFER